MLPLISLATLSLLAAAPSPIGQADSNTIVIEEFRMKLVKPASYTRTTRKEVYPVVLALSSPAIERFSNTVQTQDTLYTYRLVGSILLITQPKPQTGLTNEYDNALPSTRAVESFSRTIPGFAFQRQAKIKVAGRDALSVLGSLDLSKTHGIQEEGTLRLIFMVNNNTRMIWLFAGMNADFESKVKDFERMINSIKFLDDKPAPVAPKPAPVAPKKGK